MAARFKIDELMLFFVLSLALLFVSFGKELVLPANAGSTGMKQYFEMDHALVMPGQGLLPEEAEMEVLNPSVELFISTNGGESFESYGNQADLSAITNPDLTKTPTSYHWQQPLGDFPTAKSIVVKLKNKSTGAITEPVAYTWLEAESALPVIAVTIPFSDLFSEKKGIMTFGEKSWEQQGFYETWWFRNANFHGRGMSWERRVFFQYFENNELQFQQACGLKISGNATRGFPQKSFQLVARKTYGDDRFDFPFFGEEGRKKYASLVVRNSGNDNSKTLFADLLMHRLAEGSNVLVQKGKPVCVFLNGNYWGVYNLRERIDEYFISKVEHVSEKEVTILEGPYAELKDGSKKDKALFDSMMRKLEDVTKLDDDALNDLGNSIDLLSFIDYIIFETYYGNTDWPANNAMWYKAGNESKWKWVLNDLDYGLAYQGSDKVNVNIFERLENAENTIAKLFTTLFTNDSFKRTFKKRAEQILTGYFNPERVDQLFTPLENQLAGEISLQVNRWRMISSVQEWNKNCRANRDFLLERNEIYLKQVVSLR